MNRILIIAVIGFVVIAAAVTLFSLAGRRQPATKTKVGRAPNELVIWRPADSAEAFQDAIAAFVQDRPEVKISVVVKNPADYENESLSALSAQKGPDIWSIPVTWLPKHADKLIGAPDNFLNPNPDAKVSNAEMVKQFFVPVVAEEVIGSDQKVYGLPLSVDTLVLLSNTDLLRTRLTELTQTGQLNQATADLFSFGPRTWDELIELVQTVTIRDAGTIRRPGIALGAASNIPAAPKILAAMMLQNQTQLISADRTSATFHLPAKKPTGEQFFPGTNALEFYSSFSNPSSNRYSWNATLGNARELFARGELPFLIDFSHFAVDLKQRNPELNVRAWPLPQVRGAVKPVDYGEYLVETVTKDAGANTNLAWQFLRFLSSQGSRLYQIATERPAALKVEVGPQNILERTTFGSPNQFQQQTAKSWYRGKSPEKVEQAFAQMIDDVASGRQTAQTAIEKAAAQVSELLRTGEGISPAPISQPQLAPTSPSTSSGQGGQGAASP